MLKEVTSLADFFAKANADKRYKDAGVTAYRASEGDWIGGWEKAASWIDDWARRNVKPGGPVPTCKDMVRFLNRYIRGVC
jgi:hypothetical protein